MPISKQTTTRIETFVDALEDFVIHTVRHARGEATFQQVFDSRLRLVAATKEFHVPILNVVNGARQRDPGVAVRDTVRCSVCQMVQICEDSNCRHWHKAIRRALGDTGGDAA